MDRMGWDGMGWDGVGWGGMGWGWDGDGDGDGMGWDLVLPVIPGAPAELYVQNWAEVSRNHDCSCSYMKI